VPNPRPILQISRICLGGALLVTRHSSLVTALNRCTAADGCREQPLLAVILHDRNGIAMSRGSARDGPAFVGSIALLDRRRESPPAPFAIRCYGDGPLGA
jgi:hypothetical protein